MAVKNKERKCPDCEYCQVCSKSRCRACKSGRKMESHPGLARCFTYEEYQEWKIKKDRAESLVRQHVRNS